MKAITQGSLAALVFSMMLMLSPLAAVGQDLAPINVNTANAELLAELPGIGPVLAEAIIGERDDNGSFESADDLTRVSGIGDATVDGLRDQVEF
ncbi:ComEA family DNA-binding protein [Halomonas sp.]|jgi:competence protein ComEA|uniref:ComEA family DNA-binding protein n=1 Tax=Halomonas sp. TaxID=1486246 RepID=UPI00356B01E7